MGEEFSDRPQPNKQQTCNQHAHARKYTHIHTEYTAETQVKVWEESTEVAGGGGEKKESVVLAQSGLLTQPTSIADVLE